MRHLFSYSILLISSFLVGCQSADTRFRLLTPKQSGVAFANKITPNDTLNILKFEYVYNGGGVAIADFTNDGLQDIFFTGNQEESKLYQNAGGLTFEDITARAGINTRGRWCAGVTTVDINRDGWLDIYISCTVYGKPTDRRNLLFINQGKDTHGQVHFQEMAHDYGLDDDGHGQQAAFFDYDNDGDLDIYLLINKITQFPNQYRPKITDGSNPNTDRLYRNDWSDSLNHPVFTNVSKEAGITIEGYGLGLNITDINQDGWKDIYVTNDYAADDLLYINNKNGTFTDQAAAYFKHTSNSAMGNDVADFTNDGLPDLVAVDMAPFSNDRKKTLAPPTNYQIYNFSDSYGYIYQYMRNTLQWNRGVRPGSTHPVFSEIGLLAGVQETDWSWCPSLADFDNDGHRDLLITNGFPLDVTDRDFMAYRENVNFIADTKDLLPLIPEVKISNYAFRNTGKLTFEDQTEAWGLKRPSFSNGAAYGDLDNDGDLDYVVNNIGEEAFVYENRTQQQAHKPNYLRLRFSSKTNPFGVGVVARGTLPNGQQLHFEQTATRGYLSAVEPFAHWGLGSATTLAQLTVIWPSGKSQTIRNVAANQTLVFDEATAAEVYVYNTATAPKGLYFESDSSAIDYRHQEHDFVDFNIQNLLPFKLSQFGPALAAGDLNADGLDDLVAGGSKEFATTVLLQRPGGSWQLQPNALPAGKSEAVGLLLFDADRDGDPDLYEVSGSNEDYENADSFLDKLYLNNGRGGFSVATGALPPLKQSGSCVRAADLDNDGDLDLVIAGRQIPLKYPEPAATYILRNDSQPNAVRFTDITRQVTPELLAIGLVCDVLCTDYDNDGQTDLLLAGEWMPPVFLKNNNGKFMKQAVGLEQELGFWNSIAAADFDHDGDMDYVLGNLGLNSQIKATAQEPFEVYAGDFDKNGNYDLFPFIYYSNQNGQRVQVPFNSRDDVNKQYNPIRSRFTTYKEFIGASPETLLKPEERQQAIRRKVTQLASVYLENSGKGQFKVRQLPVELQLSPLNGLHVLDANADGHPDLVAIGNNYGNEISVGRYDASYGEVLLGNGHGQFQVVPQAGLTVAADAKALVGLRLGQNGYGFIASQNRNRLVQSRLYTEGAAYVTKPLTTRISYVLNGIKNLVEVPYGMSYLSQSSRAVWLPKNAQAVKELGGL